MNAICLICELWLVEPLVLGGDISYWCAKCAQAGPKLADVTKTSGLLPKASNLADDY